MKSISTVSLSSNRKITRQLRVTLLLQYPAMSPVSGCNRKPGSVRSSGPSAMFNRDRIRASLPAWSAVSLACRCLPNARIAAMPCAGFSRCTPYNNAAPFATMPAIPAPKYQSIHHPCSCGVKRFRELRKSIHLQGVGCNARPSISRQSAAIRAGRAGRAYVLTGDFMTMATPSTQSAMPPPATADSRSPNSIHASTATSGGTR